MQARDEYRRDMLKAIIRSIRKTQVVLAKCSDMRKYKLRLILPPIVEGNI